MDYKQKYRESLARARELSKTITGANYEYIFPELEESEDEKIRNEIIKFLELPHPQFVGKRKHKDWIAWIEKQRDKDKLIQELGKYKVKYTQEVLENYINSMGSKEDERIRKALISILKSDFEKDTTIFDISVEQILAWLEKQGKNNTGISESTKQKLEDNLNKALEKETPESWNEFLDKQGEKKTAWNEDDERIRKALIKYFNAYVSYSELSDNVTAGDAIAWLEKQSGEKDLNLVEILKHYPRETELYSPLYGKLWLAEVDEENEIITCYKYPLDEGCTRAILEQENTISFYSDGTTGLPDCTISKDCMLFLYNKNQSEQKPVEWSEEDERFINQLIIFCENCMVQDTNAKKCTNWLKALKGRIQPQSKQEWSEEDSDYVMYI